MNSTATIGTPKEKALYIVAFEDKAGSIVFGKPGEATRTGFANNVQLNQADYVTPRS